MPLIRELEAVLPRVAALDERHQHVIAEYCQDLVRRLEEEHYFMSPEGRLRLMQVKCAPATEARRAAT